MLGRWGDGGIRICLDGDWSLGFERLEGGVVKRTSSWDLLGDLLRGGELSAFQYLSDIEIESVAYIFRVEKGLPI